MAAGRWKTKRREIDIMISKPVILILDGLMMDRQRDTFIIHECINDFIDKCAAKWGEKIVHTILTTYKQEHSRNLFNPTDCIQQISEIINYV